MSSRKNRRGRTTPVRSEIEATSRQTLVEKFFGGGEEKTDHKLIQLCRQVEEAISLALVSSADPIIRDLFVVAVEPVRGAALLRVLVATDKEAPDCHRINDKLDRAQGYLRSEVARGINRKRVPSLELVLVSLDDEEDDDVERW